MHCLVCLHPSPIDSCSFREDCSFCFASLLAPSNVNAAAYTAARAQVQLQPRLLVIIKLCWLQNAIHTWTNTIHPASLRGMMLTACSHWMRTLDGEAFDCICQVALIVAREYAIFAAEGSLKNESTHLFRINYIYIYIY